MALIGGFMRDKRTKAELIAELKMCQDEMRVLRDEAALFSMQVPFAMYAESSRAQASAADAVYGETSRLRRCAADEPVFVLCARDQYAPFAVRVWANAMEIASEYCECSEDARKMKVKARKAREIADVMDAWRAHRLSAESLRVAASSLAE